MIYQGLIKGTSRRDFIPVLSDAHCRVATRFYETAHFPTDQLNAMEINHDEI
jgi:hypothetical protein